MGRFADLSHYTEAENSVWDKICAGAGRQYRTCRGLPFTFKIRGNELFVDRKKDKSLTRSTVIQTYRKAVAVLADGKPIKGPKTLGTFGASYLLPIMQKLDVLPKKATVSKDESTPSPTLL